MRLEFESIDLDRQRSYRELLKECPCVSSDYSFVNLWGWRTIYGLEWAWDGELVWIRQTRPYNVWWAPIGPWKEVKWDNYKDIILKRRFIRMPEEVCDIWRDVFGDLLYLEEDRDQWDYIYLVEELVELKGNRFHRKKNLLRQFERGYQYRYVRLEEGWLEEAVNFQADWCFFKDCDNKEVLQLENKVILDVFDNWYALENLIGGGLVVDGELVAYSVAEPLDQETLVIHFEKGCPRYKGVYQAINNIFLKKEASSFRYVNREQDLGDRGLRRAKLSYHPCCFLKKYRILPRS